MGGKPDFLKKYFPLLILTNEEVKIKMILKELIDVFLEYKKKRVKSSTYYTYTNLTKYFFDYFDKNFDIKNFTVIKLQLFIDKICQNQKQNSNLLFFNFVKLIISFAMRFDFIQENQINLKNLEIISKRKTIEDLKEEKKKKEIIYTISDLNNIFLQIKKVKFEEKFIFYFGLETGMRIGEILALTWDDINFQNNTIEITKNILKNVKMIDTPKTLSSVRTIYFTDEIKEELKKIRQIQNKNKLKYGKKYKREYRNNKELDFVFRKSTGEKITYNTLLNTINKIKRIDKKFHFHLLRHSFCSQYLKNGVDVLHVAKILGHSSVNTTLKIYSHIEKEDILNIMKKTKIQ